MNQVLPEGIDRGEAENYFIPQGSKKHSLSSLLWGFAYAAAGISSDIGEATVEPSSVNLVKAKEEKSYRQSRLDALMNPPISQTEPLPGNSSPSAVYGLKRLAVLAKNPLIKNADGPGESYFKVYRELYPEEKA
jgi:hypothetical protein